MSRHPSTSSVRRAAAATAALVLIQALTSATLALVDPGEPSTAAEATGEPAAHLVVSEVLTGGASASDEFIELYNPTTAEIALDDLELVYVTASGATITRKGSWAAGAAPVPAGGHVLLANDAGSYAAIADLTYGGGLSAAGGSVALRVSGADVAIDAVGWGAAASVWLEGDVVAAADPGVSLERLPGGSAGAWQDTDDNATDFTWRAEPDPQGTASPPTPPGVPSPTPLPTPLPTPGPTAPPVSTLTIAEARAADDGATVTVVGTALTGGGFTDGGGYLADPSGGIAVLVADGSYARGDLLQVTGVVDDRYAQRTIRAAAADLVRLGDGGEPAPAPIMTGGVGEAWEGQLVHLSGTVRGSATALSGGLAYELDDGTGAVRIFVGDATGIDAGTWAAGVSLELVGVVGQRDSTGTGAAGYRVLPRDLRDVITVEQPGTPTPAPSGSPTVSPTPSASSAPVLTIAEARAATKNSRVVVSGVVTLPSGMTAAGSAAIADASGAIYLRLSDEAGQLSLGELVEVEARRSTWTGMESLHVAVPPTRLGTGELPEPRLRTTGQVGEADEATLLLVRGTVVSNPILTSTGNVYFDLDDGSGPSRIFVSPRSGIDVGVVAIGEMLEVRGVLLQETTGQQPSRGYRLWPRMTADLRVLAAAAAGTAGASEPGGGGVPGSGAGAPSPGRTAAPTIVPRDEPMPVLTRAVATAAPPVVMSAVSTTATTEQADEPPLGQLLLAAAGILLALTAGMIGRWRTMAAAVAELAGARRETLSVDEPGDRDGRGDVPQLIPVEVVAGPADPARWPTSPPPFDPATEHRRILPPT